MDTNLGDLASVAQDPKVGDARLTTAALGDRTMGTPWGHWDFWFDGCLLVYLLVIQHRYGTFTSMICLWKLACFFHSQNWQRGHQKNNFDGEHDDKRLDLGVPSSLFHLLSITSDFIATMSPWMIVSKRNRLLLPKLLLSKWWCMYIYIYIHIHNRYLIYIYILDTYNI